MAAGLLKKKIIRPKTCFTIYIAAAGHFVLLEPPGHSPGYSWNVVRFACYWHYRNWHLTSSLSFAGKQYQHSSSLHDESLVHTGGGSCVKGARCRLVIGERPRKLTFGSLSLCISVSLCIILYL